MFEIRKLLCVTAILLFIASCSLSAYAQSGGVKGKVRSTSGGGIANATITVRQNGKDLKTVRSDSKGNFTMTGLRSGTYNVVFDADGFSSGMLYGVEVKDKVRDLGGRLILSVDQGTQVIIRGSVFFKEGTSVTGAKVELQQVSADGSTRKLAEQYTSISGEFTFRRPEGAAKLRITAKLKGVEGSKEIEVAEAAVYRTAITLDLSRNDR
jgi:hypothetical protein